MVSDAAANDEETDTLRGELDAAWRLTGFSAQVSDLPV